PRLQPPPRLRIARVGGGEAGGDRSEDLIPRLALVDLPAQGLPLLEPRHIRRLRSLDAACLEGLEMLGPDQHRVVERPRPEPRRETQRTRPVLTRDQLLDRGGQALMHPGEMSLAPLT